MTTSGLALRRPDTTGREPLLDNVRAVLISLVVVGHLVSRVPQSPFADAMYTWIYAFHMPAFALVSGHLARRTRTDDAAWFRLAVSLLVPYAAFQVLDALIGALVRPGHGLTLELLRPGFALWFLLALFTWRLLAPILRATAWTIPITVAVALLSGVGAGVGPGFGAARTMAFLPFFAIGIHVSRERLHRFLQTVARTPARVAAAAVLVASAVGAFALRDAVPRAALRSDTSYHGMGLGTAEGGLLRLALLAVALVLVAALLTLTPRGSSPLTTIGRSTLYVYLLHSVIVGPLLPVLAHVDAGPPTTLLLVAAGLVGTALLASRPVRWATRWLVEPRWNPVPVRV